MRYLPDDQEQGYALSTFDTQSGCITLAMLCMLITTYYAPSTTVVTSS